MTRISIHSIELTPLEAEVLSEILAAKLDQHIADRARYIRKDSASADQASVNIQEAGNPGAAKPALSPQPEAIVAWDLTLRCPVCNSIVEGNCREYHCFRCARASKEPRYPWRTK
jgi:hypothetical protein